MLARLWDEENPSNLNEGRMITLDRMQINTNILNTRRSRNSQGGLKQNVAFDELKFRSTLKSIRASINKRKSDVQWNNTLSGFWVDKSRGYRVYFNQTDHLTGQQNEADWERITLLNICQSTTLNSHLTDSKISGGGGGGLSGCYYQLKEIAWVFRSAVHSIFKNGVL